MKTAAASKNEYVSPSSEIVEMKVHGVLCESNLEGLTPGGEHSWSAIPGMNEGNDFFSLL